jgi:Domain of unknown function (DUF4832)
MRQHTLTRAPSQTLARPFASAVAIALVVAGGFSVLEGNAQAQSYRTVTFAPSYAVLKNPGIGYQTFDESAAGDQQLPSSIYYLRIDWSQIQQGPGAYDFTLLDQALSDAQANGQRLAFRIMGYEDGDYGPVALANAGYPGYVFTFDGYSNVYFPEFNQQVVQHELSNLISALKLRYGNNPAVDSIDVGFLGDWGEFHFWNTQPQVPYPYTSSLNSFMDNYLGAGVPIIIGGDLSEYDTSAFSHAINNRFGWRVDCWGDYSDKQLPGHEYDQIVSMAPNAWKYGPVLLETCGTFSDWIAQGYPWQKALSWAIANHASAFDNQSAPIPSVMMSSLQSMLTKIGYRFILSQATIPYSAPRGSSISVTLNWKNVGNAPMYFDRHVLVKIGNQVTDSGISMKGFLPGARTNVANVSTSGLSPGTYPVAVGLAPPGSSDPEINLAIKAAGPWYGLGKILIQ